MKKIVSFILAVATAISTLPVVVLAENVEEIAENQEYTASVEVQEAEILKNYGCEVTVGDSVYYIEDGVLRCSENNARPTTVNSGVLWVVEDGGNVYYSKIDEFVTYICKAGEDGEIAKIFCPVDCFDVEGEYVYYSYNGEVVKHDIISGEEDTVFTDKNVNRFYMENGAVSAFEMIKNTDEEKTDSDNIQMMGVDLYSLNIKPETTEEKRIYSRIEELYNWMNGKYFTTFFDSSCGCKVSECPNCSNNNIINSSWFATKFDCKLNTTQFAPYYYFSEYNPDVVGGPTRGVYSCAGFGSFAEWYIFRENDWDYVNTVNIGMFDISEVANNAKLGDLLRIKWRRKDKSISWHSGIYLKQGSKNDSLYILNSNGNGNRCQVDIMDFGNIEKVVISRPEQPPHICESYQTKRENGIVTAVGVCKVCGAEYKCELEDEGEYTYELKEDKKNVITYVKEKPYKDAKTLSNTVVNKYKVVGYVENAYKNKWYVIDYEDPKKKMCYKAYVYCDEIDNNYNQTSSVVYAKKYENGREYVDSESTIIISPTRYPMGNITRGNKYNLQGLIASGYPLKSVVGRIINADTGAVWATAIESIYKTSFCFDIESSQVNYGLAFASVPVGRYYLEYTVTDSSGTKPEVWTSPYFNVVNPNTPYCPVPTISVNSITGGQRATVEAGTTSVRLHAWSNTKGDVDGIGSFSVDFTTPGTHVLDAWTYYDGTSSVKTQKSIYVPKVKTPVIKDAKFRENDAMVTISGEGDIYYTTNGATPTNRSIKYTGPIYITDSKTIKAIAISHGSVNSDVAEKYINVTPPDAPKVTLTTKDKIAQGRTASVSWKAAARASGYTAYLLKGEEVVKTVTTTGTHASFVLDEKNDNENIEYTIKVVAENFKGSSPYSNSVKVMAMHPVTVTVTDKIVRENGVTDEVVANIQARVNEHDGENAEKIEGNVISVQRVEYNTKPAKPATPSKKGFTFAGYSGELYYPATEDVNVDAFYDVNYYTVTFYDTVNSKREEIPLRSESYMYTDSAIVPEDYNVPDGYVFAGWNVDSSISEGFDINFIEGDMVLDAVYSWANEELPVHVRIDSVVRDDKSYKVNVSIKNSPSRGTDGVQGRIITALYTAEDKNVYTQIHDLDSEFLNETHNYDHSESITLNYTDNISYASVYVVGVKGSKTGGALSSAVTSNEITYAEGSKFWTEWSDWQTDEVTETDEMQVETKTEYSYRDKSTTTRKDTKVLDGWEYDDTKVRLKKGPYTTTDVVNSFSNDYQTRNVTKKWVSSSKQQWNFYRYWGLSAKGNYYVCAYSSGICVNYEETGWIDYALPLESVDYFGGVGYDAYAPEGTPFNTRDGRTYYYGGTRTVDTSHYEYTYTDTYYTHYFYKWSEYSQWSDVKPKSADNREILSRKVYRYRTVTDNAHDKQEEAVYQYNKSGVLENITEDLSGEVATVMIYKRTNTDPTEEQIEYVSQIVIGEGNTFDISANTREEPHYLKTGDFVVTLAIEGGERLVNVDYIKAPLPQYTVNFYADGILYNSITVEEGSGVDVNEVGIPEKEGMRFVKWNKSVVNIKHDTDVEAVFEPETVIFIYVDYENQKTQVVENYYGEFYGKPTVPAEIPGKTFKYWDDVTDDIISDNEPDDGIVSGGTTGGISGGIIIVPGGPGQSTGLSAPITKTVKVYEAVWETQTFEVTFADFESNVIDTQIVEYGEAAVPPSPVVKDGIVYEWNISGNEWWNVTSNMTIYPYIPQKAQVSAPTINTSTEDVGGRFYAELEASDETATVYYSMYQEITDDNAKEFISEIKFNESVEGEAAVVSEAAVNDTESEFEGIYEPYSVLDTIKEYTEPVEVYEGAIVYAFAADDDGNISPISVFEFGHYEGESGAVEVEYPINPETPVIALPKLSVKPGETVDVPLTINNNPELVGISVIVGYDINSLELVGVENKDVFADGELVSDTSVDGVCKLNFSTHFLTDKNGTLAVLTFRARDFAEESLIRVAVEDAEFPFAGERHFAEIDGKIVNAESLPECSVSTDYTENDGQMIFNVNVKNCPEDSNLFVALYKGNTLVNLDMKPVSGNTTEEVVFEKCDFDTAKVMLWKSDNMTPITSESVAQVEYGD